MKKEFMVDRHDTLLDEFIFWSRSKAIILVLTSQPQIRTNVAVTSLPIW
jgi:hypothetical protein